MSYAGKSGSRDSIDVCPFERVVRRSLFLYLFLSLPLLLLPLPLLPLSSLSLLSLNAKSSKLRYPESMSPEPATLFEKDSRRSSATRDDDREKTNGKIERKEISRSRNFAIDRFSSTTKSYRRPATKLGTFGAVDDVELATRRSHGESNE